MQGIAVLHIPVPSVQETRVETEDIAFDGEPGSPAHVKYLAERRKMQKKRSHDKSKAAARAKLENERLGALTWQPLPLTTLPEVRVGMLFCHRWQCEQFARADAARGGIQTGVSITMNHEKVTVNCRSCTSFSLVFNLQPKTGSWKINKNVPHEEQCFGVPTPVEGAQPPAKKAKNCKSAYSARNIAVAVLADAAQEPQMSSQRIRGMVNSMGIFSRPPGPRFFTVVKANLNVLLNAGRAVDIAALEGYASALRLCGHEVINHIPFVSSIDEQSEHDSTAG